MSFQEVWPPINSMMQQQHKVQHIREACQDQKLQMGPTVQKGICIGQADQRTEGRTPGDAYFLNKVFAKKKRRIGFLVVCFHTKAIPTHQKLIAVGKADPKARFLTYS